MKNSIPPTGINFFNPGENYKITEIMIFIQGNSESTDK